MNRTLKLFLALVSLRIIVFCFAQKSELHSGKDGRPKIIQFTDTRFRYKDPVSDAALERINQILNGKQSNFIVFTRDVVYSVPVDKGILQMLEQASGCKLSLVVTFDDHGNKQEVTQGQLYDIIRQAPDNLMPDRGLVLSPDYALAVEAPSDTKRGVAVLYRMGSHSYPPLGDVKGYTWLTFGQVNQHRQQSAAYAAQSGGEPLPAFAFFHIPVPEYNEAASDENVILCGIRMGEACTPKLDTGMSVATRESGNVMGIFMGHDHGSDCTVMRKGALLAYGRFTGGSTKYNYLPDDAHIIVLDEDACAFTS